MPSSNFQKPFIDRPGVLDDTAGDPQGYVTNDGMWAAVPIIGCKAFAISWYFFSYTCWIFNVSKRLER